MNCQNCKASMEKPAFLLSDDKHTHGFCGRSCVAEWVAPELKKAVVVKQWVPTPEEEERMRQ